MCVSRDLLCEVFGVGIESVHSVAFNKHYVYAHVLNGKVMYIGSGRIGRAEETTRRRSWHACFDDVDSFEVVVIKTLLSKAEASSLEAALIKRVQPELNKTGTIKNQTSAVYSTEYSIVKPYKYGEAGNDEFVVYVIPVIGKPIYVLKVEGLSAAKQLADSLNGFESSLRKHEIPGFTGINQKKQRNFYLKAVGLLSDDRNIHYGRVQFNVNGAVFFSNKMSSVEKLRAFRDKVEDLLIAGRIEDVRRLKEWDRSLS
jgi:hypothetical protein